MPGYNTITGAGTPPPIDGSYDAELNLVDSPTPEPQAPDPDSLWWEPPNDGVDYPAPAALGAAAQPEPVSSPEYSGVAEPTDAGVPLEGAKPIESGFGKEVDDLLNQSPTLRRMWEEAKEKGWRIKLAPDDRTSQADHTKNPPIIYINPKDIKPGGDWNAKMASLLSHEIGHAGTPQAVATLPGQTREEFVAKNTELDMQYEGSAAFANARARDEIMMNGGPDIGIRGGFDDEYINIFNEYKAGRITEEEAKDQMADVMAREPAKQLEDGSYLTKKQLSEQSYGEKWDKRPHD
jgi:type VI secretion system secreted protein VgrG